MSETTLYGERFSIEEHDDGWAVYDNVLSFSGPVGGEHPVCRTETRLQASAVATALEQHFYQRRP